MSKAKRDTYFERPDLGDNVFTQIPKGEEIPPELEGKPASDQPVPKKRGKPVSIA